MRAGSWTVLADLRDRGEADTVARSLGVLETAEGFPVVDAAPPLPLSPESGEGGPSLTLDVIGERWLEVAVEPGCVPSRDPEVSEGHGAKCLDQLYLGVYGDRPFIEEVLEGLRIEDQQSGLAGARPCRLCGRRPPSEPWCRPFSFGMAVATRLAGAKT